MNNPFLKKLDGIDYLYLDQNCSINKIVVAKIPYIRGIEEEIRGKCAKDIFSTKIIVDYIKRYADKLNIDIDNVKENDLPKEVEKWFYKEECKQKEIAEKIVKKFGYRLGICLLVLKTGLKENKKARKEWTDEQWDYLSKLKNIILVGGLASGEFGEKLKYYALEIFRFANCKPYNILLFPNASQLGVSGCTRLIKEHNKDKTNIIFDFGQTFMKRCIFNKGNMQMLQSVHSKYMKCDTYKDANKLHEHIVETIVDTYNEANQYGNMADEIIISIANYTIGGKLNSVRGGYAKLSSIADNYANFLEDELEKKIKTRVKITLIHDGTAIAMNFSKYKEAICISIGTVFGMGCPDCIDENINKNLT